MLFQTKVVGLQDQVDLSNRLNLRNLSTHIDPINQILVLNVVDKDLLNMIFNQPLKERS